MNLFWGGFLKQATGGGSSGATYKLDDSNPPSILQEEQHIMGPKPHDKGKSHLKGSVNIQEMYNEPDAPVDGNTSPSYTAGITGHGGAY